MKIREGCCQPVLRFMTNFQSRSEVMGIEGTAAKMPAWKQVIQRRIPEAPTKSHVFLYCARGKVLWFLLPSHLPNL